MQVVLGSVNLSYAQLRQLATELIQQEVMADLEHRLSWIATVIKSGPLLGLFGTVLGMMAAFGRIGTGEKVQPSQIADEISIALICTAMGLLTAIPFSYVLATLNIRVRTLQDSVTIGRESRSGAGAGLSRRKGLTMDADFAPSGLGRRAVGAPRAVGRRMLTSTSRRWSTWCS